jgi:hypothetical protein
MLKISWQSSKKWLDNHFFLNVVFIRSSAIYGDVYSLQYYVIKFVTDLRQVGDFPRVLPIPPMLVISHQYQGTDTVVPKIQDEPLHC